MNKVKCEHCGTILESTYRHDFKGCKCPEERRIYVDGGKDYIRRCFGPGARWREFDMDNKEGGIQGDQIGSGPGGSLGVGTEIVGAGTGEAESDYRRTMDLALLAASLGG